MRSLAVLAVLLAASLPARAELRGHGGPVRAVAVAQDGQTALSGSFDQSAILWNIREGAAVRVLRVHEGAVNAAVTLPSGRFATGGEDGRVAIWDPGRSEPVAVARIHQGPIVALALSPDGRTLATASWDGTARLTPLAPDGTLGERGRALEGHQGNVNAVAFLPDGRLVTAGYDATLRIWPASGEARVFTLPTPLNAVATTPDGEIAAAGADGAVRLLDQEGAIRKEIATSRTPVIALAVSPDGRRIAAGSIRGGVALVDREEGKVVRELTGPGLPVWSVAYAPDGREILTGGSDRLVRRWDAATGEHIGPVVIARPEDPLDGLGDSRGAQVFRACAACHTLTPDGGNRAGPTLHGVMGRRIATAPGYAFSEALKGMDIIWTPRTVAELFTVGPAAYTPGTKMPEQVVTDPEDREALVRYIEEAGRAR